MKDYRLSAGKQKKKASCVVTWLPIYCYRGRSVYMSHLQGLVKKCSYYIICVVWR